MKKKLLKLVLFSAFLLESFAFSNIHCPKHSNSSFKIIEEDFQKLGKERLQGLAGMHHNIDLRPMIPADENRLVNWMTYPDSEKSRLVNKQEDMFRNGKISMIVLAGGEGTRFGGPKPFVTVSDSLGEFLQIKAANQHWMRHTYDVPHVPMYILVSEKRVEEFKAALKDRNFYGFKPDMFRFYVQGTVESFIPSHEELKIAFKDKELEIQKTFSANNFKLNPDGIYRFKGENRKMPAGHFDAISAFIISGQLSEALALGIDYVQIVNIDNLQAILKNDGMIAYFAEKGNDVGVILSEKNLFFTLFDQYKNKIIEKLIVRFHDNILSEDGIKEYSHEFQKEGYRFVINKEKRKIDVFDMDSGKEIATEVAITSEVGGTLVQYTGKDQNPLGPPLMKEGFELPAHFNHAEATFFNTNTMIIRLKSLLHFLEISEKELKEMSIEEKKNLVQKTIINKVKSHFELKNHEVEGEYPELGITKNGKTKILISQLTRTLLQITQIQGVKVDYLFASRSLVFTPIKEVEDLMQAVLRNRSLNHYLLFTDK